MNACVLLLFTIAKQFAYVWKFTKGDRVGTFFQLSITLLSVVKTFVYLLRILKPSSSRSCLFFFFLNQELFLIYLFL